MKAYFELSDSQRTQLLHALRTVQANPYGDYPVFRDSITDLIERERDCIPDEFLRLCHDIAADRKDKKIYAHYIRNCPIDEELPVFDQDQPVVDKHGKKHTFIGEALLELFSQLINMPLLAYETRNHGDFFHDVYAHNGYKGTQTQKTDGELYYHNDRTAHVVRADYLCLLGMRCDDENLIFTGYVDGRDLLAHLTAETQAVLRERHFVTPFDLYSQDSNVNQKLSEKHSILEDEHTFRYYETRTTVTHDAPLAARDALLELKTALIKVPKERVQIRTGDLFTFPNQAGLHAREVIQVKNPAAARLRWLLKTYNFKSVEARDRFAQYYRAHIPGLVMEDATLNDIGAYMKEQSRSGMRS